MRPYLMLSFLFAFHHAIELICEKDDKSFRKFNVWLERHGYSCMKKNPRIWQWEWIHHPEKVKGTAAYPLHIFTNSISDQPNFREFAQLTKILHNLNKSTDNVVSDGCFYNEKFGIIFKVKDWTSDPWNIRTWTSLSSPQRLQAYVTIGERLAEIDKAGGFVLFEEIPDIKLLNDAEKGVVLLDYFNVKAKTRENLYLTEVKSSTDVKAYNDNLKLQFKKLIDLHEKDLQQMGGIGLERDLPSEAMNILRGMVKAPVSFSSVLQMLKDVNRPLLACSRTFTIRPAAIQSSRRSQSSQSKLNLFCKLS